MVLLLFFFWYFVQQQQSLCVDKILGYGTLRVTLNTQFLLKQAK